MTSGGGKFTSGGSETELQSRGGLWSAVRDHVIQGGVQRRIDGGGGTCSKITKLIQDQGEEGHLEVEKKGTEGGLITRLLKAFKGSLGLHKKKGPPPGNVRNLRLPGGEYQLGKKKGIPSKKDPETKRKRGECATGEVRCRFSPERRGDSKTRNHKTGEEKKLEDTACIKKRGVF